MAPGTTRPTLHRSQQRRDQQEHGRGGLKPVITGGVGKTMLAVGLARHAAEAGHRTYFTNAADLAARCHRAAIEGRWATTMRFYAGPACLIIDELGYLPLPGEAASALFQVVNQRYLKSSIIMTTNRSITKAHMFAGTYAGVVPKRHEFEAAAGRRASSTRSAR